VGMVVLQLPVATENRVAARASPTHSTKSRKEKREKRKEERVASGEWRGTRSEKREVRSENGNKLARAAPRALRSASGTLIIRPAPFIVKGPKSKRTSKVNGTNLKLKIRNLKPVPRAKSDTRYMCVARNDNELPTPHNVLRADCYISSEFIRSTAKESPNTAMDNGQWIIDNELHRRSFSIIHCSSAPAYEMARPIPWTSSHEP